MNIRAAPGPPAAHPPRYTGGVTPEARAGRRLTISGRPIITHGLPRRIWQDLYHFCMTVSGVRLAATVAGVFLLFNLLYAALYALQPGDVTNVNPAGYWGLFFFSVETLATVGYGDMHPCTVYGHVIASCEILTGLMALALSTGLIFGRFSRPTARFLFARHAVVRPLDGMPTLMLRAANARQNVVMEAQAQLRLIREERTPEGYQIRRIHDLVLRRQAHPIFIFGWNLMHVIDAASPLYGQTEQTLSAARATLLLTVSGTDETTGQTLMARHQYAATALRWNHDFVDILSTGEDGIDRFDYQKFHDVRPLG
jgi:inward rectifier potassium channel